jgi:hypothetical protein
MAYDWTQHNYARDSRVVNARKQRVFDGGMDYKRMQFTFVTEDEDGVETAHSLPTSMQVCPTCDGRGTHVSPGVDAGGYDGSDEDYDPDTGESLYWSGAYDVTCHTCHGRNVVPSIDRAAADKATLSLWDRREEEDEEYEAVCRAERMMGA